MKRTLSLVALAAAVSMAAPVKFGADAAGILTMPSLDGSGVDPVIGFGGKVAAAAQYDVNEQLALRGSAGYLLTTYGYEIKFGDETLKGDALQHFVSLGADAVYAVVPQVNLIGGVGVDIPVAGTTEFDSYEYSMDPTTFDVTESKVKVKEDIKDATTAVLLEAGAGYKFSPALSVNALYRFALTEVGEKTKLNQVQAGVSYTFGN